MHRCRDGIDLIAVVMAAPDNKVRFQDAMALLNFGYSVSNIYIDENKEALPAQKIKGGVEDMVNLSFAGEFRYLDTKGSNLPFLLHPKPPKMKHRLDIYKIPQPIISVPRFYLL